MSAVVNWLYYIYK